MTATVKAPKNKNAIKRTMGEKVFDVFNTILLGLIAFITLYPMLYVLFASFSESSRLMVFQGALWKPLGFSTAAYSYVLKNPGVYSGYGVTLILVVVGTFINIALTSFAAFFVTRKDHFLAKYVMIMITITMFFSGGMIPEYLNVRGLGLYNSLWALMLPFAISTFNCIILRTAFASLPDSLEESAKLDGANDFTVLFRIFIPLSKATLAVLVLYYAVGHWNSWFQAMLYIQDRPKFPLQLILREILIVNDTSSMMNTAADTTQMAETIKYALIIVTTLPILCIYPFLQKYFAKGVMVGAVKG
ncbi:MAG: carbohydrate ABC transporter permease [Oscillospiraceae bacterium]